MCSLLWWTASSRWKSKCRRTASSAFLPPPDLQHPFQPADRLIPYRIVHTFAVVCNAPLTSVEKMKLRKFLNEEAGGDQAVAEKWDLEVEELKALKMKVFEN